MAWAASTSWDLTDPAYGGTSSIGLKTVHVDFDDGTDTWDSDWSGGYAYVFYDTQAPTESDMRASFEPAARSAVAWSPCASTGSATTTTQSGNKTYNLESRVDGGGYDAHRDPSDPARHLLRGRAWPHPPAPGPGHRLRDQRQRLVRGTGVPRQRVPGVELEAALVGNLEPGGQLVLLGPATPSRARRSAPRPRSPSLAG